MSLYDVKESIHKSQFLLNCQKEKIIRMLEEDTSIPEDRVDYIKLVDTVFRRLFDVSVEDLQPAERTLLEQAISDYYVS